MTIVNNGLEKTSLDEANMINMFLKNYEWKTLEMTQFADFIFIRPKGDSLKAVKILQKYLKIQSPITLQKESKE